MASNPDQVMRDLERMAENLSKRNCSFMAANLLQYYDGDCAYETKDARLNSAKKYLEKARQEAADRDSRKAAEAK